MTSPIFQYSCFLLLCLLWRSHANAQEHLLRHYTSSGDQRLQNVYAIVQDHHRFIWFSTASGVSRFDGRSFRNFTLEDGLPDRDVIRIFKGPGQSIWAAGYNGRLSVFDQETFHPFHSRSRPGDFHAGLIRGVVAMNDSTYWIWGDKLIEMRAHNLCEWTGLLPRGQEKIQQLERLGKDSMLIFLDNEIYLFRSGKARQIATFAPSLKQGRTIGALSCGRDTFAFYTASELLVLTRNNTRLNLLYYLRPSFHITAVIKDSTGFLISTAGDGLHHWSNLSGSSPLAHYLPGAFTGSVCRDDEGGLWIAATEDGVYYLAYPQAVRLNLPFRSPFRGFTALAAKDNDILLAGTSTGCLLSKDYTAFGNAATPGQVIYNRVRSIKTWKKTIWAGTDNGLDIYNESLQLQYSLPLRAIKDLALTAEGNLLTGAYNGAFVVNRETLHIDTITRRRTTAVLARKDGSCWMGTTSGLLVYTPGKTVYQWRLTSGIHITDMAEDTVGRIVWLATSDKGVFGYREGRLIQLTAHNGLAGNSCNALYIEAPGILWVGTANGVNRIHYNDSLQTPLIDNYDQLTGNDLTANDMIIVRDTLWLATGQGLLGFPKDIHIPQRNLLPVYITSSDGQKSFFKDAVLPAGTNTVEFNFTAPSYRRGAPTTYYYRLSGLDDEWKQTSFGPIRYHHLAPGHYSLEVTIVDRYSISPATHLISRFSFTVLTPFWKSYWFIGACSMSALLLLAGITYLFHRRRIQQEQQFRQRKELELNALRAQLNPHFVFNCLNSISWYLIKNDAREAVRYLTSFSWLMRRTLDDSRKKLISLDQEIAFLDDYLLLERMRVDNVFDFHIRAPADAGAIQLPPFLLQIYVENAVRHGLRGQMNGLLQIHFMVERMQLHCFIEDNGPGLDEAAPNGQEHQYQSLGMHITRERIQLLNAINKTRIKLSFINKSEATHNSTGLIVHLLIPLYEH